VTYGIVQDHHGSLSARSRPGEGTVFSLDLPAWQESQAKQASA
jgi:signal transduction histidine kinase